MLESLLDKVVGLQACNFIKKRLEHRCFPVKLAIFLNFFKNTFFDRTLPVAVYEVFCKYFVDISCENGFFA